MITPAQWAQDAVRPAHHTEDGFINPFPNYQDKGFSDFIQWSLIDRIKGNKPEKPDSYVFETVENDGAFLRANNEQYTVTWIGHSTLLIQMDGLNILTDPIWSDRSSPLQFVGPSRHVPPGIAFDDLPAIDIVIISHNHYDHLDRLTLERLGNDPLYLVPLKIGEFLESIDITNYEELDWWESIRFNGIEFVCTPAQHFSNRSLFDRNKTLWSSWVIKSMANNFYYAGDTGYFPGFKEIAEKYGPFDIAAIPIGAYLPRWFMGPVHVSPQEAVQVYLDLNARIFIPVHWGTFELADEPLDQPPLVLKQEIKKRNLDPENFWIFKHGETRIYKQKEEVISKTVYADFPE
jgi:L-ascorbate metabolism protein UlaG (beta-lactamase superfamily)